MPVIPNQSPSISIQRPGLGCIWKRNGATTTNLTDARTKAVSGDLITVRLGTWYAAGNLLKNGVDWHFERATIIYNGAAQVQLLTDAAGAVITRITGSGRFINSSTSGLGNLNTIDISNPASDVNIEADTVDNTTDSGSSIQHIDGVLVYRFNDIFCHANNGSCIYWENGPHYGNANRIFKRGGSSGWLVYINAPIGGTMTGDFFVKALHLWNQTSGLGGAIISGGSPAVTAARAWVIAPKIEANIGGQGIYTGGTTLLYVITEKLFGSISDNGGTFYLTSHKVSNHDSNPLYTKSAGLAFLNVNEWDDAAAPATCLNVSGGTLNLDDGTITRTTNGNGISVAGGVANIRGTNITVTTGLDLVQTGGTLNVQPGGKGSGAGGAYTSSGAISYPNAPTLAKVLTAGNDAAGGTITNLGAAAVKYNLVTGPYPQLGRIEFSATGGGWNFGIGPAGAADCVTFYDDGRTAIQNPVFQNLSFIATSPEQIISYHGFGSGWNFHLRNDTTDVFSVPNNSINVTFGGTLSIAGMTTRGYYAYLQSDVGAGNIRLEDGNGYLSIDTYLGLYFHSVVSGSYFYPLWNGSRSGGTVGMSFGFGTVNDFGGGGDNCIGVHNTTAVPSSNPSGGGVGYASGGVWYWRESSGKVQQMGTPIYTVGTLPATGFVGRHAFANNGRKPGEGAGAGTGVPVDDDGTNWVSVYSALPVTA